MAGKMPASRPTKSPDRTSNKTKEETTDREPPELSAEATVEDSGISDELADMSLEESNKTPEHTAIVWDSPKPEKQPAGMTATFSHNEADLIPDGRMEAQCAFYLSSGVEPSSALSSGVWSSLVDYLDFTYGGDLVPDLSGAKLPTDYYKYDSYWEGFVPSARHTEAKLHGHVKWEFPKFVLGKPPGSVGPSVPSIPWSEPDVARLWGFAKHSADDMFDCVNPMRYRFQQFASDLDIPKRCRQCRGNLHDKDLPRRHRLGTSSEAAREQARKYLEFNAPPSKKGVVGEVQKCIFDTWTGMVIGVVYWDPGNIESDFRRRNNKHWNKIARFGCWGHPGKLLGMYRTWSCCGRAAWNVGCTNFFDHQLEEDHTVIQDDWCLFEAPTTKPKSFRNAIALSCATGTTIWGDRELIRLTAIDYYSGEVLIDNLVWPDIELLDTNFRETGISWERLGKADLAGKAIEGRDAARNALFEFVGDKTILILHDGAEQLINLRMIHRHIIDVKWMVPRVEDGASKRYPELKDMANEFLNRKIQLHSKMVTFENARACRDLCRYFAELRPLPEVWIPEFIDLKEVTKNEDLCKLWVDSEQVMKAMRTGPEDANKCEVKHDDSGIVTFLKRWRVYTPSPFSFVLKDLNNRDVDEDGWLI